MKVEVLPSGNEGPTKTFSARLIHETVIIAEIHDAPHDIATKWAHNMKELHDVPDDIKYIGICTYCGSSERNGVYCLVCERVVR